MSAGGGGMEWPCHFLVVSGLLVSVGRLMYPFAPFSSASFGFLDYAEIFTLALLDGG